MMQSEPMTLGSPSSPPVAGTHSPFLPAYLMGGDTSMSSPRMWTGGVAPGSSPPRASRSIGSPTSPTAAFQNIRLDRTSEVLRSRKDKSGAPPVSGLLDDIASPADHSRLDMNQSRGLFNQSIQGASFYGTPHHDDSIYGPNMSTLNVSALNTSTLNNSAINTSQLYQKRPPASPAQIDPFYTQGESISPDDRLDETWVTVFGFPAAAAAFILQQFAQYGNIIKHVVSTEGNWLHIKYQSKLQAKKALSKNGKVFGNSIMVGVAPCIDKSIMGDQNAAPSVVNTPTQASFANTPTGTGGRGTPIRPLTAAYIAASSDRQVTGNANTPQKNSGIVTKAMEYIFGW